MFEVEQTVKYLKGAVQNPELTWNDYISENFDWKSTAVIITLPMVVVSIFVNYVLAKFVFTSSGLAHIYTGELFLKTMAFALVSYFVFSYILAFFSSKFGGEADYDNALAASSLSAVPGALGSALSSVPVVGWLISIVLSIYTLVLLYRCIPVFLKVPQHKRLFHFIVSVAVWIIIAGVLATVFGVSMLGGLES